MDDLLHELLRLTDPATKQRIPRRNAPAVRVAAPVGINFVKTKRAGRRHRLPPLVPEASARKLITDGNALKKSDLIHLLPLEDLGEAIAAAGLGLLRKKKSRTALHEELVGVRETLARVRGTMIPLKNLK
ncbi:unnamed protein product [Urochloa humidicola]